MKQRKRFTGPRASAARLPEIHGYYKAIKKQITLYLDADVLAWFKKDGRGYQTRINRALWKIMKDEKMTSGE